MTTTPEPRRFKSDSLIAKYRHLIGADEILEVGRRLGVIERQRKIDLVKLVDATILSLSPIRGTQTTAFGHYIQLTGQELAPSSFYDRFTPEFAELMKGIALRSVQAVRDLAPNDQNLHSFGVLLEHFSDIRLTDSTSHFLKRFAKNWARSTSKVRPAAIKLHTNISIKDHLPVSTEITAQRLHDNKGFPEEALEPGTLHFFDLGYIDLLRFILAVERCVAFLTRLKESHNPEILRVHQGKGSRIACRNARLDDALRDGILQAENGYIDLDVKLEAEGKEAVARVVGVVDPGGNWHWYLTNVSRDLLDAADVAEAYRLRWLIELFFKQVKSGLGLDAILAWREEAVTALVYAKVIALSLARLMELTLDQKHGPHAVSQLALVLVLARCSSQLVTALLLAEGITAEEYERRIMLQAAIIARSRNQRREREKRKRQESLGR
jgi:hypothetical protein